MSLKLQKRQLKNRCYKLLKDLWHLEKHLPYTELMEKLGNSPPVEDYNLRKLNLIWKEYFTWKTHNMFQKGSVFYIVILEESQRLMNLQSKEATKSLPVKII